MSTEHTYSAGASSGSLKTYAAGFILSIVLTVISFGLAIRDASSRSAVITGLFGAAIVQILVHLHYFLHLDRSSAARWNVLALIFTVMIMILFVGGTLWIMNSLYYRML